MQKTSVTIITEKWSAAIKNKIILHTLSVICDAVDVPNKLNESLSVISWKSCKSLDMGKNSFVWLKLHTPTFSLKSK